MKPIKAAIVSIEGTELNDDEKRIIKNENPLGIALFARNINNEQQLLKLNRQMKEIIERDDFIIAIDQEGGRVCRLKQPHFRDYISQSVMASLNEEEARKIAKLHAELIADDLHSVGVNCNFAPTLDVATPDITNALKCRCFSENEKIVAELGKIIFDTYNQNAIIPCIKHLPGHSGATVDPHLDLPKIDKINNKYFYPFEQIAPDALMAITAHIVINEIDDKPITMSKKAISEIIRKRFSFNGIIVSDALEMHALSGSLTEKTQTSISAGCDVVCYCRGDKDGVMEVLDNCGYLSDNAMATLNKISAIINTPYTKQNIEQKNIEYKQLSEKTVPIENDYDTVEVLNKLYAKKMQ